MHQVDLQIPVATEHNYPREEVRGHELNNRISGVFSRADVVMFTSSNMTALQLLKGRKVFSMEQKKEFKNHFKKMGKRGAKVVVISTVVGGLIGAALGGPLCPLTAPLAALATNAVAGGIAFGYSESKTKQNVGALIRESREYHYWIFKKLLDAEREILEEVALEMDDLVPFVDRVKGKIITDPCKIRQPLPANTCVRMIFEELKKKHRSTEALPPDIKSVLGIFSPERQQEILMTAVGRTSVNAKRIQAIVHEDPSERLSRQIDAFVDHIGSHFTTLRNLVETELREYVIDLMDTHLQSSNDDFKSPVVQFLRHFTSFQEDVIDDVFHQMVFRARLLSGVVFDQDTVQDEISREPWYEQRIQADAVAPYPEHRINYLQAASKALREMADLPAMFPKEGKLLRDLERSIRDKSEELFFGEFHSLQRKWEKNKISLSEFQTQVANAYWKSGWAAFEHEFQIRQ